MKPAMFEMSVDTRLLKQRLAKVEPGKTITYKELGEEISRHVDGGTSSLTSARRALFNETGILFSPVRGEGLVRLTDEGKVGASDSDLNRVRRAAKRGARKLASVDNFDKLPPAKQLQHTTKMSVFSALAHISSDKAVTTLESKVSPGRAKELPIAATLAAFLPDK